jgi:hypothetical protein
MDELKFRVGDEQVSGLLLRPAAAKALYLFAHGAGAGMTHKSMESNARGLAERGIATLRYQFTWRRDRIGRTCRASHSAVRAAAAGRQPKDLSSRPRRRKVERSAVAWSCLFTASQIHFAACGLKTYLRRISQNR